MLCPPAPYPGVTRRKEEEEEEEEGGVITREVGLSKSASSLSPSVGRVAIVFIVAAAAAAVYCSGRKRKKRA